MPGKYQDEIEEILRRSGESPPSESPRERPKPPEDTGELQEALGRAGQTRKQQSRRRSLFSPGKLMLGGLAIFLVAAISGFNPFIWVGLAVCLGGYLMFFIKPNYGSMEKRWRGRSVEEPDSKDSKVGRLKKWLNQ